MNVESEAITLPEGIFLPCHCGVTLSEGDVIYRTEPCGSTWCQVCEDKRNGTIIETTIPAEAMNKEIRVFYGGSRTGKTFTSDNIAVKVATMCGDLALRCDCGAAKTQGQHYQWCSAYNADECYGHSKA